MTIKALNTLSDEEYTLEDLTHPMIRALGEEANLHRNSSPPAEPSRNSVMQCNNGQTSMEVDSEEQPDCAPIDVENSIEGQTSENTIPELPTKIIKKPSKARALKERIYVAICDSKSAKAHEALKNLSRNLGSA